MSKQQKSAQNVRKTLQHVSNMLVLFEISNRFVCFVFDIQEYCIIFATK